MDRIVAQQVSVGFNRAEVVDGDDFDIGAAGFDDGAQDVAADAAEAVNGNFYSHLQSPDQDMCLVCAECGGLGSPHASFASTAATTASAVMPKCLKRSFAGADAPKECMPTKAPSEPMK